MDEIQGPDGTLMAICAEAPGCLEIDPASGDPVETCVYSKLIQLGNSSQSLASSGEKDGQSTNYLFRLVYPDTPQNGAIGKMHPGFLKLVSIIQKCKLKQSLPTSKNAVSKEENAYSKSYIHRKIGGFERKADEKAPPAHKPSGRIWKRVAVQSGGGFSRMGSLGGISKHLGI